MVRMLCVHIRIHLNEAILNENHRGDSNENIQQTFMLEKLEKTIPIMSSVMFHVSMINKH